MISQTLNLLTLLLASLITLSLIFWTLKLGIGPTPSSAKVISATSELLPDSVQGNIVELGCGWGQFLPLLNKTYLNNSVVAYERSPFPFYFCRLRFPGINLYKEDFFQADLSEAGLIICYLYPNAMVRLSKEVIPKLPAYCKIITHTFALPDATPDKIVRANDLYKTSVYLYKKESLTNSCILNTKMPGKPGILSKH